MVELEKAMIRDVVGGLDEVEEVALAQALRSRMESEVCVRTLIEVIVVCKAEEC
jgi:hypothetical protein